MTRPMMQKLVLDVFPVLGWGWGRPVRGGVARAVCGVGGPAGVRA